MSPGYAADFSEEAELNCNGHLVNVSTWCGCSSDLSEKDSNSASRNNCQLDIKILKAQKEISFKEIQIKGCYQAYEFGDKVINYLCVEKQYTATDISFFSDSLTEYPWRKKCISKSK